MDRTDWHAFFSDTQNKGQGLQLKVNVSLGSPRNRETTFCTCCHLMPVKAQTASSQIVIWAGAPKVLVKKHHESEALRSI